MIICKLSELEHYKKESANIKTAIDYVLSHDLKELPFGKTIIDGESVYINKSQIETKSENEIPYEVHEKYIDLQIDLEGDENIFLTNDTSCLIREYDEENDYALYSSPLNSTVLNLDNSNCTFLFPGELHKPGVKRNTEKTIKCVVKIAKK